VGSWAYREVSVEEALLTGDDVRLRVASLQRRAE
jgi:hypothetical protein